MFKLFCEYKTTAVTTFIITGVLGLLVFVITLGIDISYPRPYWAGIVPLTWYPAVGLGRTKFEHLTAWLESGAMTCFLALVRLLIVEAVAAVMALFFFLFLCIFISEPKKPTSPQVIDLSPVGHDPGH